MPSGSVFSVGIPGNCLAVNNDAARNITSFFSMGVSFLWGLIYFKLGGLPLGKVRKLREHDIIMVSSLVLPILSGHTHPSF